MKIVYYPAHGVTVPFLAVYDNPEDDTLLALWPLQAASLFPIATRTEEASWFVGAVFFGSGDPMYPVVVDRRRSKPYTPDLDWQQVLEWEWF